MTLPRVWPTDNWVRLAIVPALVFIATAIDQQYLVDFWHHLARGQFIVTQGQLLNHDIYTYTVGGSEFRDANWLTQAGYYLLYQQGGLALVQFVNSAVLALTLFLLVLFCWQRCSSPGLAAAAGIFAFFGSWQVLTIRPQTFSLLLFVLVYISLHYSARRSWLLLAPPLLVGLWANVHGAFPAGILLVGCYAGAAAWQAWREHKVWRDRTTWLLAACLLATVLATLANPYGWTIYEYVGLTSNRAAERGITEWLTPTFDLLITWAGVVSVALLAGLYLAGWLRHSRKPSAQEVFLILCFLPLACRSVRMVVWWLIVIAPIAAALAAELLARRQESAPRTVRPTRSAAVVFALIVLAMVLSVPGLQAYNPLLNLQGRAQPRTEQDLDTVRGHLVAHAKAGRVFTRFEWGEYLGWAAAPQFTVFMDGRIEIYPDNVWQEYIAVTTGQNNWQRLLDEYQVNVLVLDARYHGDNGLLGRVKASPHWKQAYQVRNEIYVYVRQPDHGWTALAD